MTSGEKAYGGEAFILKMPIIKLKNLTEVIVEESCKNFYKEFRRAEVRSYNSSNIATITKEEVRKMLKSERLV